MTTATQKLLDSISQYNRNPSSIQQDCLNLLEEILVDMDIVDPTSPFMFLLESAATIGAAAIAKSESVTRKMYPLLASTVEDLYYHMSDMDYMNRFATPAKTEIHALLPLDEVLANAVYLDGSVLVRTIIIPRNTQITVNGITLGTHYPIRIEILPHDIIQVKYDISQISPLETLTTNILTHNTLTYLQNKYLEILIPVQQFYIMSATYPLDGTSSFEQTIVFKDYFYFARVYVDTGNNQWYEISTTHSQIVYDINKPTAVLKVVNNKLTVSLPDIYQSLQLVTNTLRVDIYTTLGKMDINLAEIPYNNYSAKWVELDTYASTLGIAPLSKLNDMIFYSTKHLVGGTDARTLEDLREQVIYHTNSALVPVRPSDLSIGLKLYGYITQKYIDSVTDRVYIASKNLPLRTRNGLSTAVLALNADIVINVEGGTSTGAYQKSLRKHDRNRCTIMPAAVYLFSNEKVTMLTDNELDTISALTPLDLCLKINSGQYLYSPFYYILDYTQATIKARAYHLTQPTIIGRTFESANIIRNYNISTLNYNFELIGNNYVLTLYASIPNSITGVHCQLRYYDAATETAIYFNSTTNADNTIFVFTLSTTFDINQLDEIEIYNAFNVLGNSAVTFMPLTATFDVFYLVNGNPVGAETNFDNLYVISNTTSIVTGATYETITLEYGTPLLGLYIPSKDILSTGKYLTYPSDVTATYPEDIYQMTPTGRAYTVNAQGKVEFIVLHHKDDPILDENGAPITLHHAGSQIYDNYGAPILDPTTTNFILRQIGMTLINAKYKYATQPDAVAYRDNVPYVIKGYLTNEILPAAGRLYERTELYYKPMGASNAIQVTLGGDETTYVNSMLNFSITYFMLKDTINNTSITDKITEATRTILSNHITRTVISIPALVADLLEANKEYVVSFDIDKFLPDGIYYMAVMDPGSTFSIEEILVLLPNGNIDVVDTINVAFKVTE